METKSCPFVVGALVALLPYEEQTEIEFGKVQNVEYWDPHLGGGQGGGLVVVEFENYTVDGDRVVVCGSDALEIVL